MIIAKRILLFVSVCVLAIGGPLQARDEPLRVVTTTTDLAYIARQVGGDRVQAEALLQGSADPHYAQARPDYIVKLNKADVFVEVGLELEVGWAPAVQKAARNADILPGGKGYCNASEGVRILEKPQSRVDRSMGDVHALGNPHYWTDPVNAAIIARNIRDTFIRVNPAGKRDYQANYAAFHQRLKELTVAQAKLFAPYRGLKVAVYHKEFSYLAHRFGFDIVASIEEKPGVPPSAAYLREVTDLLEVEDVKIILTAPFNDQNYARSVAERVGGEVIVMPLSVNAESGVGTYEDSIATMLARLRAAADRLQ